MTDRTQEDYVRLVEEEYFGSVARQDKAAILACFTADAKVTIYHGDNQPRRFGGDGSPLGDFFDHLLGNYDPEFSEFVHFVDVPQERCAAYFQVRLVPKAESPYVPVGVLTLRNCNFFLCRDGKIRDMTIYYANPGTAGAAAPMPTGFPKAE
jgi:ketosteroid isomerase-like protein